MRQVLQLQTRALTSSRVDDEYIVTVSTTRNDAKKRKDQVDTYEVCPSIDALCLFTLSINY
jgi:hypothetical protein